jgi:hypothetical protein
MSLIIVWVAGGKIWCYEGGLVAQRMEMRGQLCMIIRGGW